MGNERSHLPGLEVSDDSIEVTEAWSMYSAKLSNTNGSTLSVFISPMFPGIAKSNAPSLILTAKNLMVHRHPCILKYVSTWSHGGRYHLVTEEVRPLSQVLDQQTSLQICLGLHNILKALVFLHEKAKVSHNNVCCAAIYVSPDGTWKLGGFEFLCSFKDMSAAHLQQSRAHRYEKAVAPEEDSGALSHPTSIDQYAFGVLVEEVLKNKSQGEEELNSLAEFRELARRQLQNSEPTLRPPLAPLLEHPFFDHTFLHIHSFLLELPLKTDCERQNFFRSLPGHLTNFPEVVVATQLGGLLLSRMVLLDLTAQEYVFPTLLQPKTEGDEKCLKGIFSMAVFKLHVVPRLLQMLCVRDAQTRLLLLSHFQSFLLAFSPEQLRALVLPELLVGIKDTNDTLVSMTLKALADLVPVLGASVVIGGKRGKLFTDGRPMVYNSSAKELTKPECVPSAPEHPSSTDVVSESALADYCSDLPERPSPDGGEAEVTASGKGEEEGWSDWDVSEPLQTEDDTNAAEKQSDDCVINKENVLDLLTHNDVQMKVGLPDIMSLDIKNASPPASADEIDFFQDMEPVISKPPIMQVEQCKIADTTNNSKSSGLFDVAQVSTEGEAWGDDIGDWGLEESADLPNGRIIS